MKRARSGILYLSACVVIAMVLSSGIVHSGTCEKWAGRVVSAQGVVEVKPAGETRWQAVKLNETYYPGETIRTDRKSRADIALYNHPVLRLDQNSTVTLGGMKDEKTSTHGALRRIRSTDANKPGTGLNPTPPIAASNHRTPNEGGPH